jgi:hypothetical protein
MSAPPTGVPEPKPAPGVISLSVEFPGSAASIRSYEAFSESLPAPADDEVDETGGSAREKRLGDALFEVVNVTLILS